MCKPVDPDRIAEALAEPFDPAEVKFKPAVVAGGRAMALAYVDARVVMDRLDEAVGPACWQDEYRVLDEGSVECRLRLFLGVDWVCKVDVGSPSEQPDEHDRMKAAYSDALKRAAVKFGVGRYLYRFPAQWVDYDAQKKRFAHPPAVPAVASPCERIGREQALALVKACQDGEVAPGDFLRRWCVDQTARLPAKHYQAALKWVQAWAKLQKERAL